MYHHSPVLNGIKTARLCVMGPTLLTANGDSLLAFGYEEDLSSVIAKFQTIMRCGIVVTLKC